MGKNIRTINEPQLTEEALKLSTEVIGTLSSILRGAGYDRRKSAWVGSMKERKKMERLVELGIVDIGIQYFSDKAGMYYIHNEKKLIIKEFLKEALDKYEWWRK